MKKLLAGLLTGFFVALLAGHVYRVVVYLYKMPEPSAQALHLPPISAHVDPSWIKVGKPSFNVAAYAQSPDGRSFSGVWSCDGPATFEWHFGADETVYVLDGRVEIDYQGQHFVLVKGDSAVFHAETSAVWHVPVHVRKSYTLYHTNWPVRMARRALKALTQP